MEELASYRPQHADDAFWVWRPRPAMKAWRVSTRHSTCSARVPAFHEAVQGPQLLARQTGEQGALRKRHMGRHRQIGAVLGEQAVLGVFEGNVVVKKRVPGRLMLHVVARHPHVPIAAEDTRLAFPGLQRRVQHKLIGRCRNPRQDFGAHIPSLAPHGGGQVHLLGGR